MAPTILVVDDDSATRKMINIALTSNGFNVVDAATAAEALSAVGRANPDVILLDLILPDGDGVDICRRIRQESDVSIIMVTAKRDLTDRLAGLDAGADDYVTKPLSTGELIARIKSLLRRRQFREQEETRGEIRWGTVTLQPTSCMATIDGRQARLNELESVILEVLIGAQGKPMSLQQIADRVWGRGEGDMMVLTTHIANLRHKLERNPENPEHIVEQDGGHLIR